MQTNFSSPPGDIIMWANFKTWLAGPFSANMDAFHWFLFFGLLIAISILWKLVLRHVVGGVEAAL
jgi:hypothetical protein